LKIVALEEKFYEELHLLECKYAALCEPFREQRMKIITGEHVPTEEESVWALDDVSENKEGKDDSGTGQDVKDLIKDMETKIDISDASKPEDFIGVPHFWLQVFKRTDLIMDMIQEHDEDVLLNLIDIKVIMKSTKPYGYTLEFHFRDNEYFTNKVLTKSYELTCDRDNENPLTYDGPVMYKCQGCTINWYKGKDVTVRTIKKRQKHKSTGTVRVILKEEKQDSFFNYFDMPTHDGVRPSFRPILYPEMNLGEDDNEEEDDDVGEDLCNADFEIGHFFKECIVPKAVLYYTGDLIDQSSCEGEGELEDFFPEDGEGNEDDDESVEDDEDEEMEEGTKSKKH